MGTKLINNRAFFLKAIFSIWFIIIILRLFYLQVLENSKYSTLADQNRLRVISILPDRGKIYDRNGKILASNLPSFQLIYNGKVKTEKEINILSKCIDIKKIDSVKNQSVVLRKLSINELICVSFYLDKLPSFDLEPRNIRFYPYQESTSHLLGYLAPPLSSQLDDMSMLERKAFHMVGRSGIEQMAQKKLAGSLGWHQLEINAKGKTVRKIDQKDPIKGEDVYLTIDVEMQQYAYDALGDSVGSVVILNPNNGDVLALVSKPSFNANDFSYGIPKALFDYLLNDDKRPLYHRATQGLYPPASTVKPALALAGLEEGVITENYSIQDQGYFKLDKSKHIFHDHKRSGHGLVDLRKALAVSCDIYFYELSVKNGINNMVKWLGFFGYGQNFSLPISKRSGLLPSPEFKKQRKQTWTPGDTVITGIGQGSLLVTPVQQAIMASYLAMRGHAKKIRIYKDDPIKNLPVINAKSQNWKIVIEGMKDVTQKNYATAYSLHNLPIDIAAKTGTAQVVSLDKYKGKIRHHQDHNWIIGFAPVEKPEIAFAVIVEHEHVASNIIYKIIQKWSSTRELIK